MTDTPEIDRVKLIELADACDLAIIEGVHAAMREPRAQEASFLIQHAANVVIVSQHFRAMAERTER